MFISSGLVEMVMFRTFLALSMDVSAGQNHIIGIDVNL